MGEWDGMERRKPLGLTEDQIEAIAERAAEVALNRVYTNIGKWTVQRLLFIFGALGLAVYSWASAHGLIGK